MKKNPKQNKEILSKRDKLFLVNSLFFLFLLFYLFYNWGVRGAYPLDTAFYYVLLQAIFTFGSLIIYHLSCLADTLEGKDDSSDEDSSDEKK